MQISESFRRFGVSDTTKDLLAIKVASGNPAQTETLLKESVQGTIVPCNDKVLAGMTDEARLRKAYKIDVVGKEAEAYVVGMIALKGS